jgi:hypothetical protein
MGMASLLEVESLITGVADFMPVPCPSGVDPAMPTFQMLRIAVTLILENEISIWRHA